jgi:hypothetical protein
MKNPKEVIIKFAPRYGYWDGEIQSKGIFTPTIKNGGYEKHWNIPQHIEWGCYELNFFMRMPLPKDNNPKTARKNFINKLHSISRISFKTVQN